MKKSDKFPIICSVVLMLCACITGTFRVSALSAEGEVILTQLASVGASLGFDINDYIDNDGTTAVSENTTTKEAAEQLEDFIDSLGLGGDLLAVADIVSSLSSGESFESWIENNYGSSVVVPDVLKEMSAKDIIMYLLEMYISPDAEKTSQSTTQGEYIFVPSETTQTEKDSTIAPSSTNETSTPEYVFTQSSVSAETDTEKAQEYITGDVNNDKKVNSADARMTLRASAELEFLSKESFNAADVNGDGSVTSKDARSILRFSAGFSAGF